MTVFSAQQSLGSGMGASRQVFSGSGIPLSHSSYWPFRRHLAVSNIT